MSRDDRLLTAPNAILYEALLRSALLEDLGRAGDLTTEATVGAHVQGVAQICLRADGVVAGLEVAARVFTLLDPSVRVELHAADGEHSPAGAVVARLRGSAASMLTGERVALNVLGRLCGIATATATVVAEVAGTGASVACTRKTTRGLLV